MAACSGVARRQHHIARHQTLNVEVELLDRTLFEIGVHGLNGSSVILWVHWSFVNIAARDGQGRRKLRLGQKETTGQRTGSAAVGETEGARIDCRIVRRVLP